MSTGTLNVPSPPSQPHPQSVELMYDAGPAKHYFKASMHNYSSSANSYIIVIASCSVNRVATTESLLLDYWTICVSRHKWSSHFVPGPFMQ